MATDPYEWNVTRARELGVEPESEAYMQALDDWRHAWRPPAIRTLLVAESHVRELEGDSRVRVLPQAGAPSVSAYCRLVYCHGYGDSSACSTPPLMNSGTPSFWRIFSTIAGQPTPRTTRERIATLQALREQGVWLVDACVTGIYMPGGKRVATGKSYDDLVRDSFRRFVLPSVRGEPIERILVIGKMVHDVVSRDLRIISTNVEMMIAPGARIQDRKWDALDRFAARHRAALDGSMG